MNIFRIVRRLIGAPFVKVSLITTVFSLLFGSSVLMAEKTYDSYKGLVMAGYQGWFNTPGDGAGRGWYHYAGPQGFKPGSCTIDLWPDVTEYEKVYESPFMFADGSHASLFSSNDETTVDTHFRWMQEYGIDGAFMQRFVSEISREKSRLHFNKVLSSAMKAARKYERAVCIMYDLSGMSTHGEDRLIRDIDSLSRVYDLKDRKANPQYLYHNGKPLVSVWGIGFNDHRKYGYDEAENIINALRKMGFSIMIGVPANWETLNHDTMSDPRLHDLIRKCDVLMPWFVGRYNDRTYSNFHPLIKRNIRWAKNNDVDYAPLCFPGFSWRNMPGRHLSPQIPRNGGRFLWEQLSTAISYGAEMIYVAMFDEIDEGTAIFKCSHKVPVGKSKFVPMETDIPNDHYMWLVGQAGKMLRKEIPLSKEMPVRADQSLTAAP